MLDKRYWVATCKHGELGFSTYATTREDFERQCGHVAHIKDGSVFPDGCTFEIKEISQDDFAARVGKMPAWVKQVIKLRREATKKACRSLSEIKPSDVPRATILGWDLRLSVDGMDGPFKFHFSARPVRGTVDEVSESATVKLGEIIQVMGGVPLPEVMTVGEAFHFEWSADDVEDKGAN